MWNITHPRAHQWAQGGTTTWSWPSIRHWTGFDWGSHVVRRNLSNGDILTTTSVNVVNINLSTSSTLPASWGHMHTCRPGPSKPESCERGQLLEMENMNGGSGQVYIMGQNGTPGYRSAPGYHFAPWRKISFCPRTPFFENYFTTFLKIKNWSLHLVIIINRRITFNKTQ